MAVGQVGRNPSALGAHDEALLYEERFVDFLVSALVLPYRGGDGVGSDGAALEGRYYRPQYLVVDRIKPSGVDLELVERVSGYLQVNAAVSLDLGEVPNPLEQGVRYSRVPRLRMAISWAAASSISTFSMPALRLTMRTRSAAS